MSGIGSLSGKLSGLNGDNDSSEEDDVTTVTTKKHPLSARNSGINRSISAFERKTLSLLQEETIEIKLLKFDE